jgi:SAM-dependent methyltransferase
MRIANLFNNAAAYKFFQFAVISQDSKKTIFNQVLKPQGVRKVLDFGCGIGYHSEDFGDSDYLGIEPLPGCVNKANRLYKRPNSTFLVGDHLSLRSIPDSSFDVIIAIGVLHHISDEIFSEFIEQAYRILQPGGRLTTFDPVYYPGQSFLTRFVISRDRGENIRTKEDYEVVINQKFRNLNSTIYTNLLRIPYDHVAFEAKK